MIKTIKRYQTVNISITFGSDFGKIKDLKHKLEIWIL